jgi:D-sorbitol dehydrogenase-like protein
LRPASEDIVTDLTRRNILTAAAATAAGAVSATSLATPAAADDAADLDLFVTLSAALTGIAKGKLAPSVDPIQVKNDYFSQARPDPAFPALLQIIRDDPTHPDVAAEKVMNNADPNIKYLGRSIILAWYLGSWYEPKTLASHTPSKPGLFPVVPLKVISPAAYTQGWTWRVAQAHPMGYSEMRFGYWADDALPLDDYIKA